MGQGVCCGVNKLLEALHKHAGCMQACTKAHAMQEDAHLMARLGEFILLTAPFACTSSGPNHWFGQSNGWHDLKVRIVKNCGW